MYSVRIPWRKATFVDKDKNFNEVIELSSRTKKEIADSNKSKGTLLDFSRGFITIEADRSELADSIFSRAHNEVAVSNMNEGV